MIVKAIMKTSPSNPFILLLFGVTFLFAFFHLTGIPWIKGVISVHYFFVVLFTCIIAMKRRKLLLQIRALDFLFFFFILIVFISISFGDLEIFQKIYSIYITFYSVLVAYLLGKTFIRTDISDLLSKITYSALAVLLLVVLDYLLFDWSELKTRPNYFGIPHSSLLIANILSCAIFVQAYTLIDKNIAFNKKTLLIWFLATIFFVTLVFLAARGALLVCLFAIFLMMLLSSHISLFRRIILCCYFISVIIFAFWLLPKPVADFYRSISIPYNYSYLSAQLPEHSLLLEKIQHNPKCRVLIEGNNSISIRKLLYQEAIELFIDNPLLGVGSGRFGFSTCGGPGTYPHSTILQAFAELGLIGGVTLISIYILSMLNLLRNSNFLNTNHNLRALFVALLAYFMISDQIYGNYTMAAGTSLIVGLSSATLVRRK